MVSEVGASTVLVTMITEEGFFRGWLWASLRRAGQPRGGALVVASVSHGVWNGLNYALFAFGTKTGALGVTQTSIYGPEVGFVGLALNAAFAAGLWWWLDRREATTNR